MTRTTVADSRTEADLPPEEVLARTEEFVRGRLEGDGSGHDWWHVHRVRRTALRLARDEGADPYVVELAALLHDVADHKFHGGDETAGP
ncbi:MAG TPA: HD domain-containing protein, partial [Longimicrobium sp.]|nr:HD domain-containing protein [Longimicrobium sp.]